VRLSLLALGLLGVAALLGACRELQIPISLDPGQYREGTETVPLLYEARSFDLRLRPEPLVFSPPSPRLTYAGVDARIAVAVSTAPAVDGSGYFALYLANGVGGCSREDVYRRENLVTEQTLPLDVEADLLVRGELTPAQLDGVNTGRLCLGAAFAVRGSDYFRAVTVSWRFSRLVVGVGIL